MATAAQLVGSLQEGFVHSMLPGGGPRHLEEFFPALEALPRSNGVRGKPTQIVLMGWTILPMFSTAATFFHFWFAPATGRIFAFGWKMAATILKTARVAGRCKTFN